MPKEITHWHIAEKAFQHLNADSTLRRIISAHKYLYLSGAVVMDTPFYLLYGKGKSAMYNLANQIHDTPAHSLDFVKRTVSLSPQQTPPPVLAFLLGGLCHVYADANFHPLVYYFSGTGTGETPEKSRTAQSRHHTLETYLDLYYLDKGLFLPDVFYASRIFKQVEMDKAGFVAVLKRFFSIRSESEFQYFKQALNMHMLLQHLFDWNLFKISLLAINCLPGLNIDHWVSSFYPIKNPAPNTTFKNRLKYRHPVTGQDLHQSVPTIAQSVHQKILNGFKTIEGHWNKSTLSSALDLLPGPNLYTGIEGFQKSEMKYFSTEMDVIELIFK
uniref:Zinc dependent phospholipase C family protein n=1 Tax=Candidatus Desulfatibia profunda TaxID=2841695 RepID=A0A8J6NLA1_9BACT|nr:zinc dependent phospholipase C family protein [Candidatus Desulfatibia profunda]